jgi:hypothetical protein
MATESTEEHEKTRSKIFLPRKHTEIHGRKDENKILMATESTEEHGKIRSKNLLAMGTYGKKCLGLGRAHACPVNNRPVFGSFNRCYYNAC